jgi:hypothetical protein
MKQSVVHTRSLPQPPQPPQPPIPKKSKTDNFDRVAARSAIMINKLKIIKHERSKIDISLKLIREFNKMPGELKLISSKIMLERSRVNESLNKIERIKRKLILS